MKFGVPWSVKGIRPEARETAREAARRSGMSVGDWLNTVILDNASEQGVDPHAEDAHDEDAIASVHERLDDLTRKIDRLGRSTAPPVPTPTGPAAYAPKRPRGETEQLTQLITRLDQRLDALTTVQPPIPSAPQQWSPPIAPVPPLTPPPLPPAYPPLPGNPIDRAIAEITARQRTLEGSAPPPAPRRAPTVVPPPTMAPQPMPLPPAPETAPLATEAPIRAPLPAQDLSGLEEQLRHITSQIETLRRPGVEEAINALREELGEIAHSLTEALPRQAMDGIEREIQSLARRVAEGRQAGIDAGTLGGLEQGLAEVRDTLRSLTPAENLIGFNETVENLAHKIDYIVAQKDPQELAQFQDAVTTLRGIASNVASNEAIGQLAAEVQAISAKVDYIAHASANPGGDALAHLEQRIAALSDALEARAQNGETVPPRLEALVNSLSDKIERVQQVQMSGGDTAALGHLEDRIVRLVEKLDASDSRLGHLEAIERGLADLLVHIQSSPNVGAGADAGPPPAVEALKRDIARTQDSLEAVNGTLGLVVDRLAMIEQGLRNPPPPQQQPSAPVLAPMPPISLQQPVQEVAAQVVAQVAAAAAAPRLPEAHNLPPPAPPAPPPPPAPVMAAPDSPPTRPALPPRKQQPIDPDLPPDHPLEPGTAPRRGGDAAARIAASEAALGGKPEVIPDPGGGKSDFIAAARRAAQTATKEPPKVVPAPHAGEPPQPFDAEDATAGSKFAKRIKSFFVASSIVALVVGSVQLGLSWLSVPNAPGGNARTEETKAAPQQAAAAQPRVIAPDIASAPPESEPPPLAAAPPTLTAPASMLSPVPQLITPPAPQPAAPDVTGSVTPSLPSVRVPQYPIAVPPLPGAEKLPNGIGGPNLQSAAAAGDASAAYEVGVRYAEGHGVPPSLESAARWFERAAAKGLAPAQFRLGSLYEKGQGVKKDLGKARALYVAAAEAGNAKAMHNLAVLYAEGIDGKPDYATAAQWFRKAADRGVSDSQYNLAILCARGLGVEKSLAESYKWFALAAAQGDKDSAKKRDDVGSRLDPQTLASAQDLVRTWTAQSQPATATSVPAPPDGWDNAAPAAQAPAPATMRPKLPGPLKLGAR
jgi:localization factor PodJL